MTVCQLRVGSGRTNWIWVWIESRGVFELWRLCLGYLRKDMAPEPQEAPSSGAELHPGNLLCKPWKYVLWLSKRNTKLVACAACLWLGHIDQTSWISILWVDLFGYDMLQPDWEKIMKKYKLLEHAWTLASIWFKAGCKLSVTTSKAEFWSRDAPPIDSCNCCP